MGLAHSPRIITNGLVLCLDAGNTKSYPGSGTTWTDLTNNAYNFSFGSAPTFNTANGGSISFNGSSTSASISNQPNLALGSGDFCIDSWISVTQAVDFGGIVSSSDTGTSSHPTGSWQLNTNLAAQNISFYQAGTAILTSSSTYTLNTWFHLVVSRVSNTITMYLNGQAAGSVSNSTNYDNYIYYRIGLNRTGVYYFSGKISLVRIYKNKGLSAAEVLQNYNALRGRFNI